MTNSASLENIVFASGKFNQSLNAIRNLSIRDEFDSVKWHQSAPDIDWGFTLLYASALTSSQSERAQTAVLRIAVACLTSVDANPTYKAGAAALLERSGNRRSVELANDRNFLANDSQYTLTGALKLEFIRARLNYSVQLSNGEILPINSFQKEFWEEASNIDWLSVSAPTSAGKSRIVREHFLEKLRSIQRTVLIYVVPTRALIEEVSREFQSEVPDGVKVINLPWDKELNDISRCVLVLTQERLHLFQELYSTLEVDVIFVDEAQSFGGDSRGILLQRTIERLVRDNSTMQLIFASPLTSNPELLVEDAPVNTRTSAFVSEAVTVNQNFIWVESIKYKPKLRSISLISDEQKHELGILELPVRTPTVAARIAVVAYTLSGTRGGNVIYVNGADEAEKVAKAVYEQIPAPELIENDLLELQSLIRTAVHEKYMLADVIERGVAFHYGNMPIIIRSEIERLFHEGKIRYLVCTSTLLEGVNLPCRTIFMRNPKKGMKNPLKVSDFWNLAGRAGRWGTEFQGNVVCIDTDDEDLWPNLTKTRRRAPISKAINDGLSNPKNLLDWVRRVDSASDDPVSEGLFSYLCSRRVEDLSIESLIENIPSKEGRLLVAQAVEYATTQIDIPARLIRRHAGISPIAMQRLLQGFRDSNKSAIELTLPFPEEPDARPRLQKALVSLGTEMTGAFGIVSDEKHLRQWQLANLIVNWMNGLPLSQLIDQRIRKAKSPATAIRNVMSDIESVARFQAPKYLSCYSDVLHIYANEIGEELAPSSDYAMLLELGVSRGSEVVLMSLGLSRTATIKVGEFVSVDDWSSKEALEWLSEQNLEGMGVPALIQREVNSTLDFARRRGLLD